jgi:C1A family cysteine protease
MKRKYGWYNSNPDFRDYKCGIRRASKPKNSDLRPFMPPVYDQGQTSSCTGNAAAGAFEYDLMKQKLNAFVPSRLFIYYNERVLEGTTDQPDAGATIRDSVKALLKYGVPSEDMWAFDVNKVDTKPSDDVYQNALKNRIKNYASVPKTDLNSLAAILTSGSPIIFGATLYESFESDTVTSSGVVPMPGTTEKVLGGHAILIVGLDLDKKAFIVRNSWGVDWGLKGYCYMPIDYVTNSDLCDDFWVINSVAITA